MYFCLRCVKFRDIFGRSQVQVQHQANLLDGVWLRLEERQPAAVDLKGRGPIECFSRPAIQLVGNRIDPLLAIA